MTASGGVQCPWPGGKHVHISDLSNFSISQINSSEINESSKLNY
jgi:hypothetical protein